MAHPKISLVNGAASYGTCSSCVLIMYIHTADNMCIFAEMMMNCVIEGFKMFLHKASILHVTVTGIFHHIYN